ncbi:hypothetical protein CLV84_1253 [Neolewinella xylanilytica]|uniref:DoxX-like protein n=1 Tax=Neolewinella xylanilytica TaxID=1514080 RepID=A0A2S6I9X7_9BACT|nr:hypothetical protein [Neolewinella xylanilytica]PPK88288.1 hypothetical protein CLV84_1253 [Neolewinella xylanilytica]
MKKETIGLILVGLVGLALFASGMMKLFAPPPEVVESMGSNLPLLAIVEIGTVVVMAIPRTRLLGILLMASYLGGVIAFEWLQMPGFPVAGVILNTLLYVGAALYRPWLTKGAYSGIPTA